MNIYIINKYICFCKVIFLCMELRSLIARGDNSFTLLQKYHNSCYLSTALTDLINN